jgi:hypothetical protein
MSGYGVSVLSARALLADHVDFEAVSLVVFKVFLASFVQSLVPAVEYARYWLQHTVLSVGEALIVVVDQSAVLTVKFHRREGFLKHIPHLAFLE